MLNKQREIHFHPIFNVHIFQRWNTVVQSVTVSDVEVRPDKSQEYTHTSGELKAIDPKTLP